MDEFGNISEPVLLAARAVLISMIAFIVFVAIICSPIGWRIML